MLKQILLASAVLISTPALAQNKPAVPDTPPPAPVTPAEPAPATPPAAAQPAPQTTAPAPTAAVPAAPATADAQPAPPADPAAPAPNAQAANPAPADPATAAAAPGPAQPGATATSGAQVADVVNSEFPTYDKNSNGSLSRPEFSAWMTALRSKADPSVKDDAANKAWVAQAFTQADSDKSKTISKDELTNFLSQGQKAS